MTINISIVVFCALIQLGVLIFNKSLNPTKQKSSSNSSSTTATTTAGVGDSSTDTQVVVGDSSGNQPDTKPGTDDKETDTGDEMQVRRIISFETKNLLFCCCCKFLI